MPPKNQRTCEHFLRGKCNYGHKCKFSHTRSSGGKTSSNGRKSNPGVYNNQANKSTRPRVMPKGSCRSFWENGTCDRGYECKFQHNSKSGSAAPSSAPITASPSMASLDENLVGRYAEAFSDSFSAFTLSPSHVQNQIMPFIQADSRFKNTQDMYQFAAMLGSANMYNSTWDIADGQELFCAIGDPDGQAIHRIRDILVHRSVVTQDAKPADLSFQRAYLPVLGYLSSSFVVKSTVRKNVNALYGVLDQNFDQVERVLQSCIEACMARKSFGDATVAISGLQIFRVVTKCLYEYATRFKNAVAQHPCFATLVTKLVEWSNSWAIAVSASPPNFKDPIAGWSSDGKAHAVKPLKKSIRLLFEVVEQAEGSTLRRSDPARGVGALQSKTQAVLDGIQMTYDGPGVHHEGGKPRHDNDHADVSKIEVVPTHAELTCPVGPYLPANLPGARHHLPGSSMERLVDIQFRLLREELIAPIRSSLTHVLHDLEQPQNDSVMFCIYTGVNFKTMECDGRRGLAVDLTFDTPRGRASDPSPAKRSAYWESVGKRRLMQGGLLGLLWIPPSSSTGDIRFYLGTVTSHLDDIRRSARQSANRLALKVSFFDTEVDIRILKALQQRRPSDEGTKILVEAPIMFESIRPFLETLKSRPPTSIPFSRYIAHHDSGDLSSVTIDPPAYVTPRFAFNLDCLFDYTPPINLSLQPRDELSVQNARNALKRSRLDPSQADAMINALISEVSLIQGPPGTGKSFTGVELLRVLISNRIRPILLIAFTNHALDNIITHVLDKGLTKNIIRLGSRSSEETVSEYTLETIMRAKPRMQADKSAGRAYAKMMTIQEEMSKLMFKVVGSWTKEQDLKPYLQRTFPKHYASLFKPPSWIQKLYEDWKGWQTSTKKGSQRRFMADFWRFGEDNAFLTPPPPSASANDSQGNRDSGRSNKRSTRRYNVLDESDAVAKPDDGKSELQDWQAHMTDHFAKLKIYHIPPIPATNRPLDQLLKIYDVWSMSTEERKKLYAHWHNQIRELGRDPQKAEFKRLKKRHAEARNTWSDMMDQGKQDLLSKADLIGCTTNGAPSRLAIAYQHYPATNEHLPGAAKLTTLLQSVAPKVLIVEEAGQVLEAHTIAIPSIEHLILIGDPLQLRPTIENYQLSMDNSRTGKVFRFDESLMERLSRMGLRMSQLDVQRRMRPEIADLVRYTLYPNLKDHNLVQTPPSVRGMAKDVFFLDHRHAEESGGDDSVSKTNTYEAKMIKDLVLYFLKYLAEISSRPPLLIIILLRQGKYTKTNDIVVLCAYLGQLTKVRKLLSSEVATVIDERDAVQLINREENDDAAELIANPTEKVQVAHRVYAYVSRFYEEELDSLY
ncbi:hypothetical protein FS837_006065 [Tulasnella sp. UAMH 9824]|nr:hypothetical protein FS837_006065 [Tulasnella sp. UAMH 9824]